jgi:hypothetical protein
MTEPAVAHCPNCNAEYRAGVTICTDCGHLLVPGPAEERPDEQEPRRTPLDVLTKDVSEVDPTDLFEDEERVPRRVVLAVLSPATAEALIERLTDEEIGAGLGNVDASGDVQVLVHDANLGDAQAALVDVTGDVSLVDDVDTDYDVEFVGVATPRVAEVGMQAARLRDAGIEVRVELPPDPEKANDWRTIATLLVPRDHLGEARKVLGIEA